MDLNTMKKVYFSKNFFSFFFIYLIFLNWKELNYISHSLGPLKVKSYPSESFQGLDIGSVLEDTLLMLLL